MLRVRTEQLSANNRHWLLVSFYIYNKAQRSWQQILQIAIGFLRLTIQVLRFQSPFFVV